MPVREVTSAISVDGVSFAWPGRHAFRLTLPHLAVTTGERLLLVGPSGCGKSTVLNLLCGTLSPTCGRIEALGQPLGTMRGPERDAFRAEHIGIIFQMFNLVPYLSVTDNVLLPLRFARERRRRVEAAGGGAFEAGRLLTRLGLDRYAVRYEAPAASLSVGQQQRVAAARALIGRPEIVLADEPTSALDRDHQLHFLDLLGRELASGGGSLIMVSHDETLATQFDRTLDLTRIATINNGIAIAS